MIKLYSPSDESELSLIVSILEGDNIPYFIHNYHFGSLHIGPPIDLFNKKTLMVDETYAERAQELLSDFINNTKKESQGNIAYSWSDKLRLILEALLFGWFIPGRRRKLSVKEDKKKT